jgi:hypothetical protein
MSSTSSLLWRIIYFDHVLIFIFSSNISHCRFLYGYDDDRKKRERERAKKYGEKPIILEFVSKKSLTTTFSTFSTIEIDIFHMSIIEFFSILFFRRLLLLAK